MTTDLQTSMNTAEVDRSASAPPQATPASPNPQMNRTMSVPQGVSLGTPVTTSRPKGMQLGGSKTTSSDIAASILAEEGVSADNPWGSDDLIDINADQDDWGISPPCRVSTVLLNRF
jgi:SCY1-like protein 1